MLNYYEEYGQNYKSTIRKAIAVVKVIRAQK